MKSFIMPREKDLGGFKVKRLLPLAHCRHVGPFVFFDHMGPAQFSNGNGINVRAHPHIGLATVTYLFEGEILHKDSLGFVQKIEPGAINYMVAGKGIVHAELTTEDNKSRDHQLDGLQLWMALPQELEQCEPSFSHYPADAIPTKKEKGMSVRVLMGEAFGLQSPVQTKSRTTYLEVRMDKGTTFPLPEEKELAVYVVDGAVKIGDQQILPSQMAVYDSPVEELRALDECIFVVIGGDPVGDRHIYWNFVSSSPDLIEKAKTDWKSGNFAGVPGETDSIPMPE